MRRRSRAGSASVKSRRRKAAAPKRGNATTLRHRSSSVRLTRELKEAREQQAATADVLKVISHSTFDLQSVLNTLAESALRLCEADLANIWRPTNGVYRVAASSRREAYLQNKEYLEKIAVKPSRANAIGRSLLDASTVHVHDVQADANYNHVGVDVLGAYRTVLCVPLLRQIIAIGAIALTRSTVRPFTDKQIKLAESFADQAVIAIENTRLLNELRQRTTDLAESLEQQTATSKVLEVISRSAFDLQAVFETVAESSIRLCGADRALIFRFDGELLRLAASLNAPTKLKEFVAQNPLRPSRNSASGRAALERRTVHIPDVS